MAKSTEKPQPEPRRGAMSHEGDEGDESCAYEAGASRRNERSDEAVEERESRIKLSPGQRRCGLR